MLGLALVLAPLACGGDDDGESASGEQTTELTGSTSAGTRTTGTGEESTGGVDIPCGDALVCSGGDVCIEDRTSPSCTILDDPEGTCEGDQTMTQCGGAGIPCCCSPPPPPEFRCVDTAGCADIVDCACLGPICDEGDECTALGADPQRLFVCEEPPAP